MEKGVIVKCIAGFYYVLTDRGVIQCRARGKFRKDEIVPLVGDRVEISINNDGTGFIQKIEERKSELIRPKVANVEQCLLVISAKEPEPNLKFLDKMLVLLEYYGIRPIICINKIDLDINREYRKIAEVYRDIGYDVIETSIYKAESSELLKGYLKDRITVVSGDSGVGKSSLLNMLQPGLCLKTGDISRKLGRGRHTTRYVELIILDFGGMVVDTPGFASIDITLIEKQRLPKLFKEFGKFDAFCKFDGCLHFKEPDCAVKKAVDDGHIFENRYSNYVDFLQEIMEYENRRY